MGMDTLKFGTAVGSCDGGGHDRVRVLNAGGGMVAGVVDGAGGTGGAGQAADLVVRELESWSLGSVPDVVSMLTLGRQLDARLTADLACGEAAAVVLGIREDSVVCMCVGDCQAWLVSDQGVRDLTAGRKRKPLLGSGAAIPAVEEVEWRGETLVAGTDGLFNYVPYERLIETLREFEPEAAAEELLRIARMATGSLQDDAGVFVARIGQ